MILIVCPCMTLQDSPINKLLYARDIPRYKQMVERSVFIRCLMHNDVILTQCTHTTLMIVVDQILLRY